MLVSVPCRAGVPAGPFPAAWVFVFLTVFFLFFNTGPTNTILANVTHPSMRPTAFALNILVIHAWATRVLPLSSGRSRTFGVYHTDHGHGRIHVPGGVLCCGVPDISIATRNWQWRELRRVEKS